MIARELAPKVGADPDKSVQAAKLAKCDLVTNMVIEFTSLEGQIGRLMYEREGGDKDIALAIEEHYKPKGPSDAVPTNPVAVAVALADKLDTLVGFWAIDEKPTGSKDPFALRRAALGVVRIILENDLKLSLWSAIWDHSRDINRWEQYFDSRSSNLSSRITIRKRIDDHVVKPLIPFILDRLKVYLRDKGIRHDLIDAVFALGGDDLVAIVNRVNALQSFLSTDDGENLLAGYKRAANILKAEEKKGDLPEGAPSKPDDTNGAALYEALQTASADISMALESENFEKSMRALAQLRTPIYAFFDNTQIIAHDTVVKENNLRLLGLIRDTARQIADFEKISG